MPAVDVRFEDQRSISDRCSTFARSSSSAEGAASNQASRISSSSAGEVVRNESARTLASFHLRAPAAVAAAPQLVDHGVGDAGALVGGDGDLHGGQGIVSRVVEESVLEEELFAVGEK